MFNKSVSFFTLAIIGCSCLVGSQLTAQGTVQRMPTVEEVPNTPKALDSAIKEIEQRIFVLQERKKIADDEAMRFEFEDWIDYQQELRKEGTLEARIEQLQKELDILKKKRALLTK
jgi:hypothetical protein